MALWLQLPRRSRISLAMAEEDPTVLAAAAAAVGRRWSSAKPRRARKPPRQDRRGPHRGSDYGRDSRGSGGWQWVDFCASERSPRRFRGDDRAGGQSGRTTSRSRQRKFQRSSSRGQNDGRGGFGQDQSQSQRTTRPAQAPAAWSGWVNWDATPSDKALTKLHRQLDNHVQILSRAKDRLRRELAIYKSTEAFVAER